jgi:uncharacterized protein YneF (UPF0154 family)
MDTTTMLLMIMVASLVGTFLGHWIYDVGRKA